MIANCKITRQDTLRPEDIFGPNLGSVKGQDYKATPWNMVTLHG